MNKENEFPLSAAESGVEGVETPPTVVPVASFRLAQTPNRANRRGQYHEWDAYAFAPKETVRAYTHKKTGSLLLVMPDGSGYEVKLEVVASQVYRHWKLPKQADSDRGEGVASPNGTP